jgi:hypothetical protein
LKNVFPDGVKVLSVRESKVSDVESTLYTLSASLSSNEVETRGKEFIISKINEFYAAQSVTIKKIGKKGIRDIDLKDSVIGLAQIADHAIEVRIKSGNGVASIIDVAKWFYADLADVRIVKEKACLTN